MEEKKSEEKFIFEEKAEIRTMEKDIARLKGLSVTEPEKKLDSKKPLKKKGKELPPEDIERKKKVEKFVKEIEEEAKRKSEKTEDAILEEERVMTELATKTKETKDEKVDEKQSEEGLEEDLPIIFPPDKVEKEEDLPKEETLENFIVSLSAIPNEGGTLEGEGFYSQGSEVRVLATPNEGFKFERWMDEVAETISNLSEYTFNITKDTMLVAEFIKEDSLELKEEPLPPIEDEVSEKTPLSEESLLTLEKDTDIEEERRAEEERIAEEERRAEEERIRQEKESEEGIKKEIAELESKQEEVNRSIKEIEDKRESLEKDKEELQSSLDKTIEKEKEIEIKEKEVADRVGYLKKDKGAKKDLWEWQEKRRLVEKERWGWDEKILEISKTIDQANNDYNEKKTIQKENEDTLKDAYSKLERIRLTKEKEEIERNLSDLYTLIEKAKERLETVTDEKKGVEQALGITKDKASELISLKEEIEKREMEESDPILKKKIEKERWNTEDDIKTLEEKVWADTSVLKEVSERERLSREELEAEKEKEMNLKRRIDEIDSILEGRDPVIETAEDDDKNIVIRYIESNSTNPESDIKKAEKDPMFFKYILDKAKKSESI